MFDKQVSYDEVFTNRELRLIADEYSRLKDICYLDHTGCPQYPESLIRASLCNLTSNVYGNPHSGGLSSKFCLDSVDQIRFRILQHFNTSPSEYSVIFTSGATASLKLVAEAFAFKSSTPNVELTDEESYFIYLEDNHTSVLGMREVVAQRGAEVVCLDHYKAFDIFKNKSTHSNDSKHTRNSLFVYSAQSNFSGLKYPLSWIEDVHSGVLHSVCQRTSDWYCMLDAATYVSTNPLDLSSVKPDFVALSFYKMFGFPTGLGALLVRNCCSHLLEKTYYGGGTVFIALSQKNSFVPRSVLHERFEDGTINFLSIVLLSHGFDILNKICTFDKLSEHCFLLARYAYLCLMRLHHANSFPVAMIYSDTFYNDIRTQGNVLSFNLLRPNGEYIGYAEVLNLANLHGIHLRTGCFCNPGACRRHLNLSTDEVFKHFMSGHVCGDDNDLIGGQPTGSVRISFGPYTTQEDVDKFLNMIVHCFVEKPVVQQFPDGWDILKSHKKKKIDLKDNLLSDGGPDEPKLYNPGDGIESSNVVNGHKEEKLANCDKEKLIGVKKPDDFTSVDEKMKAMYYVYFWLENLGYFGSPFWSSEQPSTTSESMLQVNQNSRVHLSHMFLYPVKSCGRFSVEQWELSSTGLRYDREWMVTNHAGVALTQKVEPKLCLIKPLIDLRRNKLVLTFKGYPSFSLDLEPGESHGSSSAWLCSSKVCGDAIKCLDCGDSVSLWLSHVLCKDGLRLIRQQARDSKTNGALSLSNQGQYLMISKTSVDSLTDKLDGHADCKKDSMLDRFRSNFVVSGLSTPFEEQLWNHVVIGNQEFKVDGPCGRCQMICIDQDTGKKTKEPLTTLASTFKGKMKFGVYLSCSNSHPTFISVGDPVYYK